LGAAQWSRPASREPLFAACIAASLSTLAPVLADTLAVLWWPREDVHVAACVLSRAEVVTAHGDDASVEAVRRLAAQHAPAARFVGYGARWSAVVVSRASQTPETARAVARDVALFDQQGCLSPSVILAEHSDALETWCASLAGALRDLEEVLPRGTPSPTARAGLRAWRESMRLRRALGEVREMWESAGSTAWCVALMAACRVEDVPLDRHLVVVPFAEVSEIRAALAERLPKLQGLAAALEGWTDEKRSELVALLAPTRVARAGSLQLAPPDWPQDHRPPFGSLLV
jgi:hypothetical protein